MNLYPSLNHQSHIFPSTSFSLTLAGELRVRIAGLFFFFFSFLFWVSLAAPVYWSREVELKFLCLQNLFLVDTVWPLRPLSWQASGRSLPEKHERLRLDLYWPTFQVVQTTFSYWQSLLSWKSATSVRAARRAFNHPSSMSTSGIENSMSTLLSLSIYFHLPQTEWRSTSSLPEQMSNQKTRSQFPLLVDILKI